MKRLGKTLKVATLAALAIAALWGTISLGAGAGGKTRVYWNANCWITLDVHQDVFLGTITGPGQVLEDTEGNVVSLKTNCHNGYLLAVQAIEATTPPGFAGDILADFAWKVAKVEGNVSDYQGSYVSFPGFNKKMKVGYGEKPGAAFFHMAYKYTSDEQDIPGDYSITLEYTATSL
ncbi:MAG: hypothetical protein ACUVRH_02965 [Candidatus Bipolaricaulia bacterium]